MPHRVTHLLSALTLLALVACQSDGAAEPTSTDDATATTVAPETTQADTTTSAVETTAAEPKPLPPVTVGPGTYRLDNFVVPFDLTVAGQWIRYSSAPQAVILGRGTNATTEFVVTSGLVAGSTAEDALDGFCSSGTVAFDAVISTTLLGVPALQQEGTVSADCNWAAIDTVNQLVVPAGNALRVIAADVDGTIVVLVTDAPSGEWPTVVSDVDPMIASMTNAS